MLPLHMKYDNLWPTRKVSLRCTPHFLTYSIEHKVETFLLLFENDQLVLKCGVSI